MKLLILFLFLGLTHTGRSIGETVIIGMNDQLVTVGLNTTFDCQIGNATAEGPKVHYTPVDLVWYFRPVHGNTSYIVLPVGVNTSGSLNNDASVDSVGKIKYHRRFFPHMTVIGAGYGDAGTYTCAFSDDQMQNASAQLYVIGGKPNCTMPRESVYYAGDNVTMGCSISYHGNHSPYMDWILPRFNIDERNVTYIHNVTEYKASLYLQFSLQKLLDAKNFVCAAYFPSLESYKYKCDPIHFPAHSIQYPPYITHMKTRPEINRHNPWIEIGTNFTMYCFGHGNPTITYQWEFQPVNGTRRAFACDQEFCHLTNLTRNNTGKYICTVMNKIKGRLRTTNFTLDLKVIYKDPCNPNPCFKGTCLGTQGQYKCICRTGYKFSGRSCIVNTEATTLFPEVVEYKGSGMSPYAVGAVICASLALILIVIFIFLAMKMRARERRLHQRLTRMHDENLDDQEVELLDENIQPDTSELPVEYGRLKQQWEIARKDIRLVDLIAKGSFVEVWRGRMRKYPRRNEIMKVAIKRVNAEATEKEKKFFLAELEVLKAIQPQQNILPLIGCYTASEPWLMMVEYAVEGSLYQYLQHRRPGDLRVEIQQSESVSLKGQNLTAHKLLTMATQIVNGLQYINKFKMIFYRLRAASVLVCKNGTCKLSGFGFVPDITERNMYESNSSPIRWMSPESLLDNVFNVKTDIWQFGIVLWEIVHFGHLPYPDMGPHEVSEKIHTGYRMSQPPHCSGDIYNLMLMCWAQSPENRPCFGDIQQNLSHLSEYATKHIHIGRLPEGLKSSDIVENANAVA